MSKRALDVCLASAGLALSSPLWLVIMVAVWLCDGRPVFYSGMRVGRNGRLFKMYKFRSLRNQPIGETRDPRTSETDPRITRVGRVLRNTAMDELPQLLNVLKGDISLVGPRPEDPGLAAQFVRDLPDFDLRHAIRPGLTGLAQLEGDYDSSPSERLKYDLLYIEKRSLYLDLRLLLLSCWVTFRGRWERRGKKF